MADFSFKQGEDKKVIVEIIKNGANVDVSAAPKIQAKLYVGTTEQKRYSLTPEADYGTLEVDGTDNWKVNIFLERADTKLWPVGIISIAVVVEFTDVTFPEGTRSEEYQFKVGRVLEGKGTDLTL